MTKYLNAFITNLFKKFLEKREVATKERQKKPVLYPNIYFLICGDKKE